MDLAIDFTVKCNISFCFSNYLNILTIDFMLFTNQLSLCVAENN